MTSPGPFQMDHDPLAADVEKTALALLELGLQMAERQLADKPQFPAPVEGASLVERSAVAIAIQALVNASADRPLFMFNVVDGLAYGIAAYLAQLPDGGESAWGIMHPGILRYRQRVADALVRPPGKGDA